MASGREVHAVTCGVSLLTNAARAHLAGSLDLGLDEAVVREMTKPKTTERAVSSLGGSARMGLEDRLLEYAERDPRRACAELNALGAYLAERGVDLDRAADLISEVHLIASDTASGTLTAEVLARFLRERGLAVSVHTVRGFQSGDYESALENLRSAVKSLVDRFGDVVLNLTGGFKAEVAALSVLAAESGLRAYYIHESARRVVFLPTASRLKVRTTWPERALALISIALAVPFDSLLGSPWFLVPTIPLALFGSWLALRMV
ncbi:MAG: putative CRISPR-associated protein [Candidatus Korarchaeota archaeon]|nr:putative CRISPR-associated protein [Candidatus Korarchaeota archaeon]